MRRGSADPCASIGASPKRVSLGGTTAAVRRKFLLEKFGGAEEDRTPDLRIANATLSQLSYGPTVLGGADPVITSPKCAEDSEIGSGAQGGS